MDLGVTQEEKVFISQKYPAGWKTDDIRYLGIKISASMMEAYLIENNITPNINWMHSQFGKWSRFS